MNKNIKEILITILCWFALLGLFSKLWTYGYEDYIVPNVEMKNYTEAEEYK